jgi:hypothetical protein
MTADRAGDPFSASETIGSGRAVIGYGCPLMSSLLRYIQIQALELSFPSFGLSQSRVF